MRVLALFMMHCEGGLITSKLMQQQLAPMETTALAFSCNWSPPSDILVKAVPLSGNIQLLLCTLCMHIERGADVDSRRTNCQQQRGKTVFFANYERNTYVDHL